jgi:glycosyltransferase involved in cell wall biosynthesis
VTARFALLVPALNEERTLNAVIDRLLAIRRVDQLVVINDGSKDRTGELLRARLAAGESRLRVVTHEVNRGKGAAIRSGLSAVTADFAVIQDADTEYDPNDLDRIFTALESGEAPVIFGSRFLKSNPNLYRTYLMGNKLLTAVANLLAGGHLTDAYTCYKGMSTENWRKLRLVSSGFEIEAEISMKCLLAGWRVLELPISYRPRSFADGKKIRPKDAIKGILKMLQVRMAGRWRPDEA